MEALRGEWFIRSNLERRIATHVASLQKILGEDVEIPEIHLKIVRNCSKPPSIDTSGSYISICITDHQAHPINAKATTALFENILPIEAFIVRSLVKYKPKEGDDIRTFGA